MLHHKRWLVLLALVISVAMVLSSCALPVTEPAPGGQVDGDETPSGPQALPADPSYDTVLNWNLSTEPPTLDPNLGEDTTSIQVLELLFLGLTDFDDETLDTIPELGTDWEVSEDGLVWTFTMRDDVSWVRYDPVARTVEVMGPVTAHDIAYSARRTLDPDTASYYAYVNYIIQNGEAANVGEADLESVGVRAVDDYTVEFTLEQPAGYFPGIAGMWINRPVPSQAIAEHGDQWTEPGNIWTNGPYMLETWEHENRLVVVKNPYYYGAQDVQIGTVDMVMVTEASTAFAMYENGELDVVDAPLDQMDRIKADPQLSTELFIGPRLCTYYYGFNTQKAPFDNAQVRLAFSMAIDRQKLIDTVLKGEQLPAKSFACPGIFGGVAEDDTFEGVQFDAAGAQALLAEAGYPNGEGLPDITLVYNTSEAHQKIAEFVQQEWNEHLGVDIRLANQEWNVYLNTVHEDAPQVYRLGWCADYPDQNNWVHEVFHPTKSTNDPKWDPEREAAQRFMAATEGAAASADPAEREALYREAEGILVVEEAIIAPIYYYTRVVLNKPYVQRTYAPLGGEHFDKWTIDR